MLKIVHFDDVFAANLAGMRRENFRSWMRCDGLCPDWDWSLGPLRLQGKGVRTRWGSTIQEKSGAGRKEDSQGPRKKAGEKG